MTTEVVPFSTDKVTLEAFEWHVYRDSDVEWVDPVPVLKRHLDGRAVEGMLEKG